MWGGVWNVADASKELNPVKYFVGCWTDVGGRSSGQEYRRLQRSHYQIKNKIVATSVSGKSRSQVRMVQHSNIFKFLSNKLI